LKHAIVKEGVVVFGPSPFNKELFNKFLRSEGLQVAISTPSLNSQGYEILEVSDNLPDLKPWQALGKPVLTVHVNLVEVTYPFIDVPFSDFVARVVDRIYGKCEDLLNAQIVGRSQVEVNRWESLKKDIEAYIADGSISTLLEHIVLTSNYTVDQMVGYVGVRSAYEDAVFVNRFALVSRVMALEEYDLVAAFDVEAGWPLGVQ